jgi:aminopeptidase N
VVLKRLESEGSEAFDWLTAHAGPYPFSSLGVVVVDGDSAMETQTMITLGRDELSRPDSVLAHEMAHQWFGDSLTPRTWQGLWLNEGWAMYMEQWYESDTGRFPYAGGITRWRRIDQLSRDRSGPPGDYDPDTFADVNVYLGPAMMLDAIRQRIGDRAFDALVRAWPAQHRYDTVDRAMFTRWLRSDTGLDLRPLLDRWLDAARTPRLPG